MLFKTLAVNLLLDQRGHEVFTLSKQALFPTTINFGVSKGYTSLLRKSIYGHNQTSRNGWDLLEYLGTRDIELHHKEFGDYRGDLAVAAEPANEENTAR